MTSSGPSFGTDRDARMWHIVEMAQLRTRSASGCGLCLPLGAASFASFASRNWFRVSRGQLLRFSKEGLEADAEPVGIGVEVAL